MSWPPTSPIAAGSGSRSPCPSEARSGGSWRSRRRTRSRRSSRERAEWLADAGEARRGAHRARGRARAAARPRADRVLRHEQHPGHLAVGCMVVFVNGRPEPKEYRRFRIRSGDTPDDFRMMAEVLRRRFSRVAKLRSETGALSLAAVGGRRGAGARPTRGAGEQRPAATASGWAVPDLVIVDGGKGQLSAAVGVLRRARHHRRAARRAGEALRGALPPGPSGADRAAAPVAGAVPRAADPGRGASVRDHLPPRRARQARAGIGARRDPGDRPGAQEGAPQAVRVACAGSARRRSRRWPQRRGSAATWPSA